MTLVFTLNKQKLKQLDDDEIAGYTRNHIGVKFIFDKLWCNLQKYALFSTPNGTKYVVKLGYGKERSCDIPDEILQNVYFRVSVFADDLLTSTTETVLVSSSGYTSEIDDMDMEDGNVLESNTSDITVYSRKKHFDEECNERLNKFEIAEHPYY